MAVLLGKPHSDNLAILQQNPSGSLNVEKKELNRVVNPHDFFAFHLGRAAFNFGAAVIGYDSLSFDSAAQLERFELGMELTQIDDHKISRHCINGIAIARARVPAALEQRFIIS